MDKGENYKLFLEGTVGTKKSEKQKKNRNSMRKGNRSTYLLDIREKHLGGSS